MAKTTMIITGLFSSPRVSFRAAGSMLLFLSVTTGYSANRQWSVSSPDSALVIEAKQDIVTAISSNEGCYFRVLLGGKSVIDWSPMGVTANGQDFVGNLTFVKDYRASYSGKNPSKYSAALYQVTL